MNEACLNAKWLRCDLTHPAAVEFTKNVLNHMRERLIIYQGKYGDLYNLEATPAEVDGIPPRKTRRPALSRHYHRGETRRNALLHQLLAPACRIH